MKGGNVQWNTAMELFQTAEDHYLHGYKDDQKEDNEGNALKDLTVSKNVSKQALQQMNSRHIESIVNVRHNMGELLRQQERYGRAVAKLRSALDVAKLALECEYERHEQQSVSEEDPPTSATDGNGPSTDEQRNLIVELQVKIADTLMSDEQYDEAAEAYEAALTSHIFFRRWSDGRYVEQLQRNDPSATVLPATSTTTFKKVLSKSDLTTVTTMEAAIRKNLAHALAQIGRGKLSHEHYESSLAIFRHHGGDFHMEVANTLMGLGALLGGPMRDFSRALNCFKEALHIYRNNLDELDNDNMNGAGGNAGSLMMFEESEEIEGQIQNALKNISLIEAALLKERDGAKKRRPQEIQESF